ncbi:MAG: hypothetical protein OHK0013_05200 [Sandaracinaceae bacterium]
MDANPPSSAQGSGNAAGPATPKLVPFGKYLLLERVAVGGMAEVWLAKRMQGEGVSELLAVKRILPNLSADAEFIKMFVDEARIAGQLQHPGIVPMLELGRIGQSFYIAMEYVWGRDLLQILRTVKAAGERIAPAAAAYIGAKVCEALHYAHVKTDKSGKPLELVHRDVSPQNVLVSFDGKVKLIDFGIAKAATRTTQTQAGTLKGKVGYMSPEQVRGQPVDARSDLFAVGTLLYEMLTVRPLFARGNNFEAMNRVREADVPPLLERAPDCPPTLAAIVMRALAKEPVDRYASAQEMQRALALFLADHASAFERYDLATWLRRIYADEFAREKARLDALDSIGRPAVAAVAKRHTNPVTSLEIASVSIFDAADDEEATQVAHHPPPVRVPELEAPSEVFFHRDEVVPIGAPNPDGHVQRPLKGLFRPGKADAVEAYRAPIVARDEPGPPGQGRTTLAPPPTSVSAVAPPADTPAHRAPTVPSMSAAGPSSAPPAVPRGKLPPARPATPTLPHGHARPGSGDPRATSPQEMPRITAPQFTLADPNVRDTVELAFLGGETIAGEPTTMGGAVATTHATGPERTSRPVEPPAVERVALPPPEEDDATFDDGGIREPLVPPTVSRARIVAISDRPPPASTPPGSGSAAVPPPAPMPTAAVPSGPARPGTVSLVDAGDTPSTSAITRALEQMAREASGSGPIPSPQPEPIEARLSGFELDPQQLDSQIIRQILPTPSHAGTTEAPRRGEPTESFSKLAAGRAPAPPTLVPRPTPSDYLFFAVVALLMIALGGTSAVALLYADPGAALEVRCVPDVPAAVLVDGAPRGRAPVRIEALSPGRHTLTLVADGFEAAHRQVVLTARETSSVEVALRPVTSASRAPPVPAGALPPPELVPPEGGP